MNSNLKMSTVTTIDCLQTRYFSADDLVVEWVTWPLEQASTSNCTASTNFRNLRQYDSLLRIITEPVQDGDVDRQPARLAGG